MSLGATLHQVFVGIFAEFEVTLVVEKLLLLVGQATRLSFEAGDAAVDFVEAHLGIVDKVIDILQQSPLGGDNLLVDFDDFGVLLRLGEQFGGFGLRQSN